MNQANIRNFAIIAHIDHGKSTLADRLLEATGTVAHRDMQAQLLDSNPIERERGITIKLAPVRMIYTVPEGRRQKAEDGNTPSSVLRPPFSGQYILNLIDTPGHVDFGYEVSRSLAACEGAILVVDATQGVQAQTLANLHQARINNLTIIPVINKIDLINARVEETLDELSYLGFNRADVLQISAKTGLNIGDVLSAIVERIPAPQGNPTAPPRALVFSSQYDPHRGVVVFVRVVDGSIHYHAERHIKFLASNSDVMPIDVGYFMPKMTSSGRLETGEVGYIATGLKDASLAKIGDTITVVPDEKSVRSGVPGMNYQVDDIPLLAGYKEPKSMVFVGLFPLNNDEFTQAREAMEKLRLSDSAFNFRPISSMALGNGFHCGFLGLLHAEVVQERLVREFDLSLLATAPSVEYRLTLNPGVSPAKVGIQTSAIVTGGPNSDGIREDRTVCMIQSAAEYPDPTVIEQVEEPIMNVSLFCPRRFVGPVMQLATEKRGEYSDLVYQGDQAQFTYLIPLSEMIIDFFDRLKSITEGYASLDYEFFAYQPVEVAKVDILVNKERVDALAFLVVKDQAQRRSREIVERLAEVIPRQQFTVPVQGAIGGQIIARADIKAFRKDVIAHLYGGDRTRKDKLLNKQKKGKAKMKLIGRVEIPQTAFFEVLKKR